MSERIKKINNNVLKLIKIANEIKGIQKYSSKKKKLKYEGHFSKNAN